MGVVGGSTGSPGSDVHDRRNTLMIYSKDTPGSGVWHCPFPPSWVEKMKRAVQHCENLSAEYIERTMENDWMSLSLPPGNFLSQPQNARGMPIGYDGRGGVHVTCDIYDYDTIPDVVITNGHEDWPIPPRFKKLQA